MIHAQILFALIAQASPSASPCMDSTREATIVRYQEPALPKGYVALAGLTIVEVMVARDGTVASASIYRSSGNDVLDRAALRAAMDTKLAPKIVNCQPVIAQYLLRDEFDGPNGSIPPSYALRSPRPDLQTVGKCVAPSRAASISGASAPRFPDSERMQGFYGPATTIVELTIGLNGDVEKATIFRSSGHDDIDQEALRSARGSTYYAKVVNCQAVEARYLYRVTMDASY